MKSLFLNIVLLLFVTTSCENLAPKPDEIICHTMYVQVGVDISGARLDSTHTVRLSSGEIISLPPITEGNNYVVLADNYHPQLTNQQDTFLFVGFIQDSMVVQEPYVIRGDDCHIGYVQGKKQINL